MVILFCITFFQNLSRVMRHKKKQIISRKTKKFQNHEGSCNLGKTFWNPKKLLISSMEKKYQLCALLESGIGGLNTLDIIISPMENILEPPEVEKCPKNWPKLRNFESLSWLWKTRFGLWRVFWSLTSLLRFVMSRFDVR